LVDVDNNTYLLSEVMAKKNTAQVIIFGVFGGMFRNVTTVSLLDTSVLCEINLGKPLKLGKSEA
jgi:hypothetical protein